MIVDVHSHNLLPEHWGDEHRTNWEPAYGTPYPHITPAQYDEAMIEAGVDVAIVFGLAATRAGVHTPNTFVAEYCAQLRTPTIAFTALDPLDADWREQLDEAISLGFRGVKLYPVLSLFDPLSPDFDEFYRTCTQHGLVLLWHMGATPSPQGRLSISQPLIIEEVARRHPDLTQIMAHMGHPWQRDTMVVLRKHARVFADVSAAWARPMDGFMALVAAQEWGVTGKLLFGSDFPLWRPADAMSGLRSLAAFRAGNLPHVHEDTVEHIIHRDALALLGLDDPRTKN
ncbi:MAG: amidohydrolase [Actinobacteria bacterium]|jgi:predicted TIM-barrel fold metal-dependent hydrolase|nr:MAG: amidohydrolase [Actinomycetota bacterium]HAS33480.1 metal-dependent hydrolase [Microbacterium sp.]HIE60147.1 amidohydrolase [Microbacterium sp.]|tara:strand:- start:654 stop:1508 length:855 start_codon:yes stop_codon:yes gene_type:complete